MDISHLREEYTRAGLEREQLADNPFEQFDLWFRQAQDAQIPEPNAMSLATASENGMPSLRTVLLKYFDKRGFVFFTNYESSKAQEIEVNPKAAMMFPWVTLERQVIIQGAVEKISKAESLKYFISRPHGSQLGAWVSSQSNVITNRTLLELKLNEVKQKFSKGRVPLPSFWGGYRIVPERFEFWQGRPSRLHDRFEYLKPYSSEQWEIQRLQP